MLHSSKVVHSGTKKLLDFTQAYLILLNFPKQQVVKFEKKKKKKKKKRKKKEKKKKKKKKKTVAEKRISTLSVVSGLK